MQIPSDLRYSSDHEWARADAQVVRVGITDYAQDALGDVVFVDLPKVNTEVSVGGVLGEVDESARLPGDSVPVHAPELPVGGVRATAEVRPWGTPLASIAPAMATPVAKRPQARRNTSLETACGRSGRPSLDMSINSILSCG